MKNIVCALLFCVSFSAQASNDSLAAMCMLKLNVVDYTFAFRDSQSTESILELVHADWESYSVDGYPRAMYIDMQRIVRDITRKNADGEWVHPETGVRDFKFAEAQICLQSKF